MSTASHFDGKKYFNPGANPRGILQVLKWLINRRVKPWPFRLIEPQKILKARLNNEEASVTFINHSTLLLQIGPLNILTDPIWAERASPFKSIGPKRAYQPGVRFDDLPPIDIVLVSHNHYDHLDTETLRSLQQKHTPRFYTSKGNGALLKSLNIHQVTELDWWDHVSVTPSFNLHCVPAQHFSGRGLFDRNRTLWSGFFLKSDRYSIYFAGDTGYGSHFKDIQHTLGSPHLACIPIGAFKPEWFMHPVHLSPKDAVQTHLDLGAKQSIAMHFDTFQLGDEEIGEAPQVLLAALQEYQLSSEHFKVLEPGESHPIYYDR